MFTGLIERTGRLTAVRTGGAQAVIEVACAGWAQPLTVGESVAVHGACLTVVKTSAQGFACDVLAETLARTNLGAKRAGDRLNLERATRVGDTLGGHIVSGHVDGTGRVRTIGRDGKDRVLQVACGRALLAGMIPQGSVAVDGVSLTISRLNAEWFQVNIIPHTWSATALGDLRAGQSVNIETDMLGKYARQAAGAVCAARGTLSIDNLRDAGFA
jgi:riboflavin synthase